MYEMAIAFAAGFTHIFVLKVFSLMLLGLLIGFLVGILPGLGGPSAMALMLPFIVRMSPVEAFSFLLAMSAVSNTTGDITSILIGVPGEPSAAATIVDGHPMAKKGEAGRALGAALMSSLIGAVFGAFALALAIPIVRPIVMTFGSPEFFMLAILGLTFVASLSGGGLLKGLLSGGIGFFLSTVGLCQMSSIQRFTLGQTFLWDGIGLIPITIGFFAIPEIIDLAVQGSSIARNQVGKLGGVMEGVKDTFRHWWLVIRCSAIGTFCSIIPGFGAGTTQWLAYAHAVQSSRSPDLERFGKGAVEGVLGPGAANNSTLGGSLITTVAFGVPASVTMAILLGAFIIHGIVPGPDMLIPESRGGHLTLIYSFVWVTVISNIITVLVCFLFLGCLVKVTYIRGSLLIPFIVLLIYLGAFAEKNAFEDLYLVMFFGALGWVMTTLGWPRPPLILGLVLGPLAEKRLFLSMDIYGLTWLLRTGVLVILAITIIGAVYPFLKKKSGKKIISQDTSGVPQTANMGGKGLQFGREAIFSLSIVIVFTLALWESRHFDLRTGLFPWAIGFPVLGLGVTKFIKDILGKESKFPVGQPADEGMDVPVPPDNRRTLVASGWIIAYFMMIWFLGFSIGGVLCAFIHLKFGSREKWIISTVLTFFVWAIIYGVFERTLHVPFPPGELLVWLKIA